MNAYNTSDPANLNFFQRNVMVIKPLLIGLLVLLLLIPASMIESLVSERKERQQTAMQEINDKYGRAQTVTGPVLVIPYLHHYQDDKNTPRVETAYAYVMPEQLKINGQLQSEIRKRGIYKNVVYDSDMELKGLFKKLDIARLGIAPEDLLLDKVVLSIGLSDTRGISNEVGLDWNKQPFKFDPGVINKDLYPTGILSHVPIALDGDSLVAGDFDIHLSLRGSEQLYFSPVGSHTEVTLTSNKLQPSYDGAFLPKTRASGKGGEGFTAGWQVLQLNRDFPQSWVGNAYNIEPSNFGVRLMTPVDTYLKTNRAAKYAILIIGLTFLFFYFIEMFQHRAIHPFQYVLIGLALCIFYTLLLSLSEQLNFESAYLAASILTVGLITAYAGSLFKNARTSFLVGGALSFLYGFIYVLLQSEDNALLMGSIGLFVILAIVMYLSRKIRFNVPVKAVPVQTETDNNEAAINI